MSFLLLGLLALLPAQSSTLGLLPIRCEGCDASQVQESRVLGEGVLRGTRALTGVEVLSLWDLPGIVGPERARAILGCPASDDLCVARQLGALRPRELLIVEYLPGPEPRARARLVETSSTAAPTLARASVDAQSPEQLSRELVQALFEGRPGKGQLTVASSPSGASVLIGGKAAGVTPYRVAIEPGTYDLELRLDGYDTELQSRKVWFGETTEVDVRLHAPPTTLPWVLSGTGLGAVAASVVLQVLAGSVVSDWETACAARPCAAGFTQARYDSDDTTVSALSAASIALGVVGAGLLLGGGYVWLAR